MQYSKEESLHIFVSLKEQFSMFYFIDLPQVLLHQGEKPKKLIGTVGLLALLLITIDRQQ